MNMVAETLKLCEDIAKNARIDYEELQKRTIDEAFFQNYENVRIVNSFLFNFSKLQDKIGAKLFRQALYAMQEINDMNLPMVEILSILEKLDIVQMHEWQKLREIRNILAHEYPYDVQERIENIHLAMQGFVILETIFERFKSKLDATGSK